MAGRLVVEASGGGGKVWPMPTFRHRRAPARELEGYIPFMIRLVALDADDTLWHQEPVFSETSARFRELLQIYADPEVIQQRLDETEARNLQHYGYGVKAFTLSMIETALELGEGRVEASEIAEVLRLGRGMLAAPLQLLDGAADAVHELARGHELMLLTKGDLLDQETKLARSGLGDLFRHVEVVTRKDRATYERVLAGHGLRPREFVMVGDSLRSDVAPVAAMGAHAVHVPYPETWVHERIDPASLQGLRYLTVGSLREVPEAVSRL